MCSPLSSLWYFRLDVASGIPDSDIALELSARLGGFLGNFARINWEFKLFSIVLRPNFPVFYMTS